MKHSSSLLALLFLTASGCASPADEAPVGDNGGDELSSAAYQPPKTCGQAKWNEAFKHYKKAVDTSKVRLREQHACSSHAYLVSIVDDARTAADTCHDFSKIIAESPWAQPLRSVMSDTLDLDVITKRVSTSDWSGLDAALKNGVTFYDTDGGVLGNRAEVHLGQGVVTAVVTEFGITQDGDFASVEKTGSYEIGKRLPDGSIEIILTVNASNGPDEVMTFRLGRDLQLRIGERTFFTTPSECEA